MRRRRVEKLEMKHDENEKKIYNVNYIFIYLFILKSSG